MLYVVKSELVLVSCQLEAFFKDTMFQCLEYFQIIVCQFIPCKHEIEHTVHEDALTWVDPHRWKHEYSRTCIKPCT